MTVRTLSDTVRHALATRRSPMEVTDTDIARAFAEAKALTPLAVVLRVPTSVIALDDTLDYLGTREIAVRAVQSARGSVADPVRIQPSVIRAVDRLVDRTVAICARNARG